jgi:LacI family transcriptional regulator
MPLKPEKSGRNRPVNLKVMAEYLDLSPATVSIVLNNAPGAKSIAPATRERVLAAAKKLDYRPNTIARSLRMRQTFTIGVIVPELSEGYFTMVMNGVEQTLMEAGYIYMVLCHQGKADLIDEYPRLMLKRAVDGFIFVNTTLTEPVNQPVVSISGHAKVKGVSNIQLDHDRSAMLALKHLRDLGHKRIVFMKGQSQISDAESRWQSILKAAALLGMAVIPELCVYITGNSWSPELGYPVMRDLLARTKDFTAIFCFNDVSAIGAIRALADAGLSCPGDVSVVGFDDIASAMYQTPSLTTVRQPLHRMGEAAAQLLLQRIQNPTATYAEITTFEPELMVRESTGAARTPVPGLHATPSVGAPTSTKVLKGKAVSVKK